MKRDRHTDILRGFIRSQFIWRRQQNAHPAWPSTLLLGLSTSVLALSLSPPHPEPWPPFVFGSVSHVPISICPSEAFSPGLRHSPPLTGSVSVSLYFVLCFSASHVLVSVFVSWSLFLILVVSVSLFSNLSL